jgi:phosphatidylglycerol lysyltransferase
MEKSETQSKIIQTASILVVLVLFYVALWVLRREIHASHFADVIQYIKQMPTEQFLVVFLASMGSYFALTFYDALGFWNIKKSFDYPKIALTSFISYSFSHNIGAAVITGGGIRYRFYSALGLTAGETANVLVICGSTYWVGFLAMGSVFFFLQPPELPDSIHLPFHSVLPLGIFCGISLSVYLLMTVFLKGTLININFKITRWIKWNIFQLKFPMPSLNIAMGQMAAACCDWVCSGGALYLLLPKSSLSFSSFLAIYLLAQIVGFLSQVPGGLGILEAVMMILLEPVIPRSEVFGALLAFRLIYYLIPFVLGLVSFATYEIIRNKEGFKRALQILNRWAPDFLPHVYAVLAFLSGAMLLFSNASPEVNRQMIWLNEFLPLSFLESAHFLTGMMGAWLLVLGRSLQQRLESAYYFALVLLGLGILGCFFKGFAYQEALLLLCLFIALLFSRGYFRRKGSIFQQRYSPLWITVILFVWLGSIWLGFNNYRYEDYSNDLWTTFDIVEDAARFLRSSFGATAVLLIFSIISLISPSQPETEFPKSDELDKAQEALGHFNKSYACLALLGDKALLFNKKRDAFLIYAIEGKSWIVLGDPVGHEKDREDLVTRFRNLCRIKNAMPVFYQVDQNHFQFYLNLGLTVLKISEEARVVLSSFQLENVSADLKNTFQRFKEKEDYEFDVIPSDGVQAHIKELRAVSESWLSFHKTREKGFSAGFFQASYLKRCPVAVVRKEGKIVAFANILQSHGKAEASIDLLRSVSEEPKSLDDYLLLEVMFWMKNKNCQWFNLGTAGILDMEESPLAPFEQSLMEILSPYIRVSHLTEIRKEKDRFMPEWSPKYLAYSANLSLEVAFNNIASLISRGNRVG